MPVVAEAKPLQEEKKQEEAKPELTPPPVVETPPQPLTQKEQWMKDAGIPENEWPAVDYVLSRESGWCPYKWEGEFGACPAYHGASETVGYGLCQATPPGKMASAGSDWQTNPVTQLKWCTDYARSRYGGWPGAQNAWSTRLAAGHGWW